jgi:integrase
MFCLLWLAFRSLVRLFRDRRDLILANIVLRQQLVVLKRRHPRPALHLFDKVFWVTVGRLWSQWKQSLIVVTPETVIRWHRADFHMYQRPIPESCNRFELHNLRHSLSNWLVNKAKIEPKTVQGILRHAKIQTTLDLYTQQDSDETRAAQGEYLMALGVSTNTVQ